jgi:mRNA interferase HigB
MAFPYWEVLKMRIIALSTLREFWEQPKYKDAEQPLKAWYDEAQKANWQTPQDIKDKYRNASFVADNRVVFNIHGNKYRLIVALKYQFGIGYVRFIGTHKQYDAIDANTI